MRNQKGGPGESNLKNFFTKITDMPYENLIMILSLLSVKDAVVTSSVCKKWKFLWCDLTQLNFDASESWYKISKNNLLYSLERSKYIKQVNSVIQNYNHPVVHKFRINFDFGYLNQKYIDEWLQFIANKRVEILELDMENAGKVRDLAFNYESPSTLNSNPRFPDIVFLKKLYFNNVRVWNHVLEELLTRCPHLESISIHGSKFLTLIRVGGRHLKIKHFEIKECFDLQSIYLSDFDLVSFTYMGPRIDLCFNNLPNFKEFNICQELWGLEHNVFSQISSCVSSLQTLSFTIHHPMKAASFVYFRKLPNVKKLTLIIGAHEDDRLYHFFSISKACPNIETLIIKLLWFSPIRRRRKGCKFFPGGYPFGNLKLFKILGYYGRVSDLELSSFVIENAVELKNVVIDPRCKDSHVISTEKDLLKKEKVARCFALRQFKSMVPLKPPGVKLVIL